jgi:hypothetical protein
MAIQIKNIAFLFDQFFNLPKLTDWMISQGKDVNSLLRYRRSSVHFYSATTTFYTEIHIFFETVLSLQVSKSSYLRLR